MKTSAEMRKVLVLGVVVVLMAGLTLSVSGCQRVEPPPAPTIELQDDLSHRVAAGWRHSLAVLDSGHVLAWVTSYEGNQYGQIDVPEGLENVVAVAAGERFSLALTGDDHIVVWGEMEEPSEQDGFTAIAAGRQHALALREDGTVFAWGSNALGQLDAPTGLTEVVAIAAGGRHSLAVTAAGAVVAWGDNAFGQCNVPATVKDVVQIAAGWGHSMALTRNGEVVVWGADTHRQLQVSKAIQGNVHSIAAGWWHSFAVLKDGSVSAWGGHSSPNPNFQTQLLPTFLRPSMGLAAGEGHVVVVNTDGTVQSWGYDLMDMTYGLAPTGLKIIGESIYTSLGPPVIAPKLLSVGGTQIVLRADGTVVAWGHPSNTSIPEGLADVVDIVGSPALGGRYVMAVTRAGMVVAWGRAVDMPWNAFATVSPDVPLPSAGRVAAELRVSVPEDLPRVTAVAGGSHGAIALTQEGTVVWWSFITTRDTGSRTFKPPKLEVVQGLSDIVQIAAGMDHFLALRRDGTVFAWGDNEFGQATVPSGGDKYKRIFAWGDVSFAIRDDGTLVGWGDNSAGQLDFPEDLTDVVDAVGRLALREDGTVVAWGNWGSTAHPKISDARAISTDMALLSDGTIVTWGRNQSGHRNVPPGLRVIN